MHEKIRSLVTDGVFWLASLSSEYAYESLSEADNNLL
jgi:hypothetical protein